MVLGLWSSDTPNLPFPIEKVVALTAVLHYHATLWTDRGATQQFPVDVFHVLTLSLRLFVTGPAPGIMQNYCTLKTKQSRSWGTGRNLCAHKITKKTRCTYMFSYKAVLVIHVRTDFCYQFRLDQLCNQTTYLDSSWLDQNLSSLFLKLSTESTEITSNICNSDSKWIFS